MTKFQISSFFKSLNSNRSIYEVEEQKLEFIYQFMYDNDPACEYVFDKEIKENPKQDINDLMADIVDRNIVKYARTRDVVLGATHHFSKKKKKVVPVSFGSSLWLLTFTLGPHDEPAKVRKRMLNSLSKYKFMYTEEYGSKNGRYHIHCIVETFDKRGFEKGYNLKPTNDHAGNIDRVKYRYNNDVLARYLSKETPVKGDVDYIRDLIKKLPKSPNCKN